MPRSTLKVTWSITRITTRLKAEVDMLKCKL